MAESNQNMSADAQRKRYPTLALPVANRTRAGLWLSLTMSAQPGVTGSIMHMQMAVT